MLVMVTLLPLLLSSKKISDNNTRLPRGFAKPAAEKKARENDKNGGKTRNGTRGLSNRARAPG